MWTFDTHCLALELIFLAGKTLINILIINKFK